MLQPFSSASPTAPTAIGGRSPVDSAIKATSASASSAKPVTEREPNTAELGNIVADLNKVAQASSNALHFSVDDDTGRTVVKVVDTETDKVLRQIPTMEALKLWRSMEQMQGVMLRDKA